MKAWWSPNGSGGDASNTRTKRREVRFKLEKTRTQLFPELYRPIATVSLWSQESQSWKKVTMMVDTGADYTIIPRYVAIWAGIEIGPKAKKYQTTGVGGNQAVQFIEKQKIKLGPFEREIPLGIIDSTTVPPLMGRQGFFNEFEVLFKDHYVTFSEV